MWTMRRALVLTFAGLLAYGSIGGSEARAQHPRNHGHATGHRFGPSYGYGPYRPGYRGYGAPRGGYYLGGSYYGGGRYGRPWGYSYSNGYIPGYGAYYGSSYYGRGFCYSTYGGYCR
jgi:hypothetical protein